MTTDKQEIYRELDAKAPLLTALAQERLNWCLFCKEFSEQKSPDAKDAAKKAVSKFRVHQEQVKLLKKAATDAESKCKTNFVKDQIAQSCLPLHEDLTDMDTLLALTSKWECAQEFQNLVWLLYLQ